MKLILTGLLALIMLGCGEDSMATIAIETDSTLTTTNVTDSTQAYDVNTLYADGEIVQDSNNLYVVNNTTPADWLDTEGYITEDIVTYSGLKYKALLDLRYSPETINIALGGSNGLQNTYRWFLTFGDDAWTGSGSIIYYKVPGAAQGNTYTFTLQSSQSEIYDVHIVGDISGDTNEVWTVKNSYINTYAVNTYFTHEGKLYQTLSINNLYFSPDSTSIVGGTPWVEVTTNEEDLTLIGVTNDYKPFDGQNITPAISSSPMTYTIEGTEAFNSFTLAKVLASSVTYTFRNDLGATIKTETIAVDCKRDGNGTLSLYPTTVIYYAGQEMPIGSTVQIELTHDAEIELGDFILNNAIDSGFTDLSFSHGVKDYNNYTPDAWGNIPEAVKAIVTTFNVTLDIYLTNYDYAISFNESISGKNVTIDASDSDGAVANGTTVFSSLTRRVRVTNVTSNSIVKDGELSVIANTKLSVQEIV